jgi:hypothetical protein
MRGLRGNRPGYQPGNQRLRSGSWGLPLCVGLLASSVWLPAASAQPRLPSTSDEAELALPDIDAIERGAKPRASASFGTQNAQEGAERRHKGSSNRDQQAPAEEAEPAAEGEGVRRLQVAPPPNPGGHAGIYGLDRVSLGDALAGESRPSTPESHTVGKGETMSSVCERYFGDPFCWPRLWAENPQVTNPHWIFPGDVIRLRAGTPAAARPAVRSGMRVVTNRRLAADSQSVLLREAGYIDKDALAESAHVSGSREEKIMLASGDQAYVTFDKSKPMKAGERYSVFVADTQNPVRDPETGATLGYLVRVYGDIAVDQISDKNMARGTLMDVVEPVERGFAVSRKVRLFKTIEPKPAATNLEARIVASFAPTILLAAESFVVISRGGKDGLSVGNRIFVVRRGDGYRPLMEGWAKPDMRYPKEVVAELWIMEVSDSVSVAWVARSSKELRVGEVAELRKGH